MNASKYLALVAVIIFGVSGLASAQEGYFGQQATPPPAAAQSKPVAACLWAALYIGPGTTAGEPVGCLDVAKHKRAQKKAEMEKNTGAPRAQEGDPAAPQNQIEYRGGGM